MPAGYGDMVATSLTKALVCIVIFGVTIGAIWASVISQKNDKVIFA
ncbi:MAG: hypothetical protein ACLTGX_10610 [Clostridium sp.]